MYSFYPTQISKVNGMKGAEAYQMLPNSSILLLDECDPIVYLVQTDASGVKRITAYDIQEHHVEDPMSKLEERMSRLEKMYESHFTNAEQT